MFIFKYCFNYVNTVWCRLGQSEAPRRLALHCRLLRWLENGRGQHNGASSRRHLVRVRAVCLRAFPFAPGRSALLFAAATSVASAQPHHQPFLQHTPRVTTARLVKDRVDHRVGEHHQLDGHVETKTVGILVELHARPKHIAGHPADEHGESEAAEQAKESAVAGGAAANVRGDAAGVQDTTGGRMRDTTRNPCCRGCRGGSVVGVWILSHFGGL